MNYLSQLDLQTLSGKRVLVRLDLNVPLDNGRVADSDADRVKASLQTLQVLKDAGAKVVVISHIGRDPEETLRPVVQYLENHLTVGFVPGLLTEEAKAVVEGMSNGTIVVLENLRSDPREEQNDEAFARELAAYGDLYVNDAFAVSHRAHASVVGVPKHLPSYAGFQMEKEVENLSRALSPEHPALLVLGGAKFETKLPVIEKFLPIVDRVIIGGALANNMYKARGYEVGLSLLDADANVSAVAEHASVLVPETVVVENAHGRAEKHVSDVEDGDKIADMAPAGLEAFADEFANARFILWNGPMGNYENGFTEGSQKIVEMIAASGAYSVVGGGDSVALIEQLGMTDKFSFLSTGGGAMLEYLAQGTLPGIEALSTNS